MNSYVALLRGINVGGNNIIKMENLRKEFEKIGMKSVKTYIQSGNVFFKSDLKDSLEIEKILEKHLSKSFKYKSKVLVRTKKEMELTIFNFPKIFDSSEWKHNIIFLCNEINSKEILNKLEIKKEIEQTHYSKGVLYWSAKIKNISKSKMIKLSSKKEYQLMTVRNINTTKKILEIMNED